jgi:hypothetical protein
MALRGLRVFYKIQKVALAAKRPVAAIPIQD